MTITHKEFKRQVEHVDRIESISTSIQNAIRKISTCGVHFSQIERNEVIRDLTNAFADIQHVKMTERQQAETMEEILFPAKFQQK